MSSDILSCYWPVSNNCGDLVGPYLLEKIINCKMAYAQPVDTYEYYVIGGSVINHVNKHAVVWGAGLGTITDGINPECKIASVRGPITRARALSVGAKCPAIYGDPALLLPRFYTPQSSKQHRLGILAHYVDQYRAYHRYPSFKVISVLQPLETVIDEIYSCEAIASSSLHGIIIAHAYGIPATWVKMSDSLGGDGTKFRDYFASVGMDVPEPFDIRENQPLPPLPTHVPAINTDALWKACPIPTENRKREYR